MTKKRNFKIKIIYYAILCVGLIIFFFSNWGRLALPRLSFVAVVSCALLFALAAVVPLINPDSGLLRISLILYQGIFFVFSYSFLFRLATFEQLPYRMFRLQPFSFLSVLFLILLALSVYLFPLLVIYILHRKILTAALITGLLFWGTGNAVLGHNWFQIHTAIEIDPQEVAESIDFKWSQARGEVYNVTKLMNWVHGNIEYSPADPVRPLPDLIDGGEGTCGVQAKILHDLLALFGEPGRIITLHPDDWHISHTLVEAFADGKWILLDPQFNLIFYDDNIPLNAWELSKNPEVSSIHPYGAEIFENILIFSDGVYAAVDEENYSWFY